MPVDPIVENPIDYPRYAVEDWLFELYLSEVFSDADPDDVLTYGIAIDSDGDGDFDDPLPDWLTFDAASGVLSGTPLAEDAARMDVLAAAVDPHGGTAVEEFELVVISVNDPPTLVEPIPDVTIAEDQPFALDVAAHFTDEEGAVLTYNMFGPDWLSIDPVTGALSGTPTNGDVGDVEVTVMAFDGGTSVERFTITVENVNDAPIVTPGGTVDLTFGDEGAVRTAIGDYFHDLAYATAVQADGKILLAGQSGNNSDFALARYNSDGSLDTTFGTSGVAVTDIGRIDSVWGGHLATNDEGHDMLLQGDGKIVVAGLSNGDFTLARYNPDGSLDTSFSGDGKAHIRLGSHGDHAPSVALQADGKLVVAGYSLDAVSGGPSSDDFSILRFNADGSLDSTFGDYGRRFTDFGGESPDHGYAVALQTDGKIVVAGSTWNGSTQDIALVRYNADGSLDTTFGGDGKVTTLPPGDAEMQASAHAIEILPDGGILVAALAFDRTRLHHQVLVRYDADGSLDTTFGENGYATANLGHGDGSIAVQEDGKIVLLGSWGSGFGAARFNADGSVDSSFGVDGVATAFRDSSTNAYASDLAIQADGRIVLGGSWYIEGYKFGAVRLMGGGIPDQAASEDAPFELVIPANHFTDVDAGDILSYAATLEDGLALPSWLTFDPGTRAFSGTPLDEDIGAVSVRLTATDADGESASDVFAVTVSGTEDPPAIVGYDDDDVLIGTGSRDTIQGGDGNDMIAGGGGDDELDGEQGDDTLRGGAGRDAVFGGGGDDVMSAGTANDYLKGEGGEDVLAGNSGSDYLRGAKGNDTVRGGQGNDHLFGETNNDVLVGGKGADQFQFSNIGVSHADVIADFGVGQDAIVLDDDVFRAFAGDRTLGERNFVSGAGARAKDANDFVLFDTSTGKLFYDADGSGAASKRLICTLLGSPDLEAHDILIVS
jgi:uncharacterized delta-60 repeat protein